LNHGTAYRHLNQLEDQLGSRLFERLPDGYQLTEAGERLLPFAENIESEAFAAPSATSLARTALWAARCG
jgi:DNA-binding transcriptional LysR family regulator